MASVEIQAEAALVFVAIQQQGGHASLDQIDQLAVFHRDAKQRVADAQAAFDYIETSLVELVKTQGVIPPNAEKSRRLTGNRSELQITKADRLTINHDRVADLREALASDGYGDYFGKLFAEQTKFEIVEGAEAALKNESLPKRLAGKVLNLWARCITVTPKKPSLKVTVLDPAKPAKRSAKKAVAQ